MLNATRFLGFLIAAVFVAASAWAQGGAQGVAQGGAQEASPTAPPRSIFTVGSVDVDITATSAASARQSAIAQSRRLAFTRLFKRLVATEDLEAEPALTNAELAGLVRAIDILEESTSQPRYIAQLAVSFEPEKVTGLLERLGVTYTDSETPPILVLPLAHYGGVPLLLSEDNVWAQAWQQSPSRASSLVDYRLPERTPDFLMRVSPMSVPHAAPETLIELLRVIGASDVLVAEAAISLDFASQRYLATFDVRRGPGQGAFMTFDMAQQPDESPQDMLERAIAKVDAELSALWKRQLLIEFAQAQTIAITAQYEAAADWRRIRGNLGAARRLRDLQVLSIALDHAELKARFFGDFDSLEKTLAADGLAVRQNKPGLWDVRVMTMAERAAFVGAEVDAAGEYVDPISADAMTPEIRPMPESTSFDVPPWEMNSSIDDAAPDGTSPNLQDTPDEVTTP